MDDHLVEFCETWIYIVDLICVKRHLDSLTLRNVRRAQAGPAVLTVKIGLEVVAFSVICDIFLTSRGISRELKPVVYLQKNIYI